MAETIASHATPGVEGQRHRVCIYPSQTKAASLTPLHKAWIRHLEIASDDIALRLWIVDNSHSMVRCDRTRFGVDHTHTQQNAARRVKCTRWEELKDTVLYQAGLAVSLQAPALFRVVTSCPNVPREYEIASEVALKNDDQCPTQHHDMCYMERCFQFVKPNGRTDLTDSIEEIRPRLLSMKASLRAKKQSVVLILATDRMPSEKDDDNGSEKFIRALRMLEDLPIIVVVRLSTDDDQVRHFYSELRCCVKLRVVILKDYMSEMDQIQEMNNWITYIPSCHLIREFGYTPEYFDHISERLLTHVEMRDMCFFLLGYDSLNGILDPLSDWYGFLEALRDSMIDQRDAWYPSIHQAKKPIIDIRRLTTSYRPSKQKQQLKQLKRLDQLKSSFLKILLCRYRDG